MRKKYLSALLFGALLVTSTGTFTSCKDYDDDINNLQEQITSNKDAIAALQKLVSEGKWVTSISPIENGFTVTMSDGTTQNITGINGEDGKPGTVISLDPTTNNWIIDGVDTGICAKGEKGDQGDQGEQGPAGEDGAQGAQGEPGKNAPSPQIDPETGNWIVYAWDEATGDYKATVTDIYAQAAKIFVTEKEGFIELNVDGVAYLLPTTSDAYTVQAPTSNVSIFVETAKWNPTTTSKDYQALLKAFPEIGKIEKGSLLKQGAELPVLITPSSIDLTDGFKFSLQTLKGGLVEDITLANPTKGISDEWNVWSGSSMSNSRSANAEDCYWTLQVEQELKDGKYATTNSAALVVENANGKVVKTPFAYSIYSDDITSTDLPEVWGSFEAELSSEIDLLSSVDGDVAPIYFRNEYKGKYIITLTDQLDVEKYGLEIVDGHKLVIKNPGNNTTIPVKLNIVVLGLNGKTTNVDRIVTVAQSIASTGELSTKNITLSTKAISTSNTTIGQIVTWNFDELGFTTATQKQSFIDAQKSIELFNEDGKSVGYYSASVVNAEGDLADYSNAKTIQFELPSLNILPGEYKVVLTASNGASVVYKTETSMIVSNPKVEDLFGLASAYTTDGKVLQVVGEINGTTIEYHVADGIVLKNKSALTTDHANNVLVVFKDLDHTSWLESDGSQTWGKENWIEGTELNVATQNTETSEGKEHLYKERNIRATYYLFGGAENSIDYDFKVKVLSPVYTADGSNVTVDESKMTGKFGATIDPTANITATYAAGINKGKTLNLFTKPVTTTDYAQPEMLDGTYVKGTTDGYVEIDHSDLIYLGVSSEDIAALANYKIYLSKGDQRVNDVTIRGWDYIYNNQSGSTKVVFNKYKSLVKFGTKDGATVHPASEIKSVTFAFVNSNDANKYCTLDSTGKITVKSTINESDLANGKAVVAVKMTVKDYWGMTMTKTFNVTITK